MKININIVDIIYCILTFLAVDYARSSSLFVPDLSGWGLGLVGPSVVVAAIVAIIVASAFLQERHGGQQTISNRTRSQTGTNINNKIHKSVLCHSLRMPGVAAVPFAAAVAC